MSFTRTSWNGRMKACRGIGASLTPEEIAAWEKNICSCWSVLHRRHFWYGIMRQLRNCERSKHASDTSKNILSATNGMNLYRGCTHGCIYCDSRSACYQMGHDFEDVAVKENAPQLLEEALRRKRRLCMIGTGAMSDPYLHCEEQLGLTRQCLELIAKYGFGATVLTKSDRVLRDLDLLQKIQQNAKCVVQMTLTTWNETLCRILEPHVCTTRRRYEVLEDYAGKWNSNGGMAHADFAVFK